MSKQVLGIVACDLQLCEKPPLARSVEEDWLAVEEYYVGELVKLEQVYSAPVLLGGDVFEHWNAPARLISEVIRWLKGASVYGIPGNHDLPEHSYHQLHRSAYWTLVEAGVLTHLAPDEVHSVGAMQITAFPYGFPLKPPLYKGKASPRHDLCLQVALCHAYVWGKSTGRPGAPEDNSYATRYKQLRGYDVAVFGDNHKPFLVEQPDKGKGPTVCNVGTFMRRHADERGTKPSVALLYEDGSVGRHYFDTTSDRFLDLPEALGNLESTFQVDMTGFAREIGGLEGERLSFVKYVLDTIEREKPPESVKALLLQFIGAR
jgi:hypothetical protein